MKSLWHRKYLLHVHLFQYLSERVHELEGTTFKINDIFCSEIYLMSRVAVP